MGIGSLPKRWKILPPFPINFTGYIERMDIMGKKLDLTGQRFGRLTVVKDVGSDKQGKALWECSCDCGNINIVPGVKLRNGHTRSCGCLRSITSTIHGKQGTRVYNTWSIMLQRCNNHRNPNYHYYGGRGISVCPEWELSFVAFYKDMGDRPKGLSLDRINNNLGYFKENCRWVNACVQSQNQRIAITNKSGIRGVSWNGRRQKWHVRIEANKIKYHIGGFATLAQAKKARMEAEQKYWHKNY